MEGLNKIAARNFKKWPKRNVQYIFPNGYCFFRKQRAEDYKKSLKKPMEYETFTRDGKKEVTKTVDQTTEAQKQKAIELIDQAIADGKITEEQKAAFVALAEKDYENTKTILAGMKASEVDTSKDDTNEDENKTGEEAPEGETEDEEPKTEDKPQEEELTKEKAEETLKTLALDKDADYHLLGDIVEALGVEVEGKSKEDRIKALEPVKAALTSDNE